MNYHKCDDHLHKEHCPMPENAPQHEMPYMKEKMEENCYSDLCSDISQLKCKVEKECVKTYKSYYKLYKVCQYRIYKVCPCCGHEFDYHRQRGVCPKCGATM